MIKVSFMYEIGERVEIVDLKRCGLICSLWCGERGLQYEVAYWVDGERKKEYLFGSEIKPIAEDSKKVGFSQ